MWQLFPALSESIWGSHYHEFFMSFVSYVHSKNPQMTQIGNMIAKNLRSNYLQTAVFHPHPQKQNGRFIPIIHIFIRRVIIPQHPPLADLIGANGRFSTAKRNSQQSTGNNQLQTGLFPTPILIHKNKHGTNGRFPSSSTNTNTAQTAVSHPRLIHKTSTDKQLLTLPVAKRILEAW